MGFITSIVNYVLWLPVKWFLELLNVIDNVVNFLAKDLLETILFGGKVTDWNQVLIPHTYYRIIIIGMSVWLIVLSVCFLGYFYKDSMEMDETPINVKIWRSLKMSFMAGGVLIFMPMALWLIIKCSGILEDGLLLAFGSSSSNVADMLYNIGNPAWDGVVVNYNGSYPKPGNLSDWNMIVELFSIIFIFLCLLLVTVNLVLTIFTMFFYFICTFFYAMAMVFDDGARLKQYAKSMGANSLQISTTILIFGVFSSLLQLSNQAMLTSGYSGLTRMLLEMILSIGGAIFVLRGTEYVTAYIGENITGVSDAKSALGLVSAGAIATWGASKAAFKFGKSASKRALIGRKNTSNSSGGNLGSNSYNDGQQDAPSGSQDTRTSNAQNNVRRAAESASQRTRPGGLLGVVGSSTRMMGSFARTSYHGVGAIFGSKAQRLEHREHLKASASTLGGHIKNVVTSQKVINTVGGVAGTVVAAAGVTKYVQNRKAHKKNVYSNEAKVKDLYKNKIDRGNEKMAKTAERKAKFTGYANATSSSSRNKKYEVKHDKISKRNERLSDKQNKITEKWKTKVGKYNKKEEKQK